MIRRTSRERWPLLRERMQLHLEVLRMHIGWFAMKTTESSNEPSAINTLQFCAVFTRGQAEKVSFSRIRKVERN